MDTIPFTSLARDIWPLGTPTAHGDMPQLYDYALGGLEIASLELERRAILAHKRSKMLLDIALHTEDYDFTA